VETFKGSQKGRQKGSRGGKGNTLELTYRGQQGRERTGEEREGGPMPTKEGGKEEG